MPIEYEKAPVETFAKELSSTLKAVAYFRRRVLITYKGIPMGVIAPMEDLALLEDADRRIFEQMAKEVDAQEPPPDAEDSVSLEDLLKEARKRERRNRLRRKRSGAKRRKLPRTHQNMYLVRAMLSSLKKREASAP